MDRSRQWVSKDHKVADHHLHRYKFARLHAKGRILDAACGCGYGSTMLAQSGVVTGVDFSPEALDWAEEKFPGPSYILGRIEDEPWEGRFDTVVSLETIEHIPNPARALQAFRRACVGKLIASVPNQDLYPFKAEDFAKDTSPHFRHYTPGEFESLLIGNGFEVLERHCQVSKLEPEVVPGTGGKFIIYVCE